MAGSGTPEPWAKRLAEVIGKIRTRRNLSRPELARRMYDCLPPDEPADSILRGYCDDKVIQSIEEAARVKIPRDLLELLCSGLKCTPIERLEILQSADRNVFADANGNVSDADQVLLQTVFSMRDHPLVQELLRTLVSDKQAPRATKHDLDKMIKTILLSLSDLILEQAQVSSDAITVDKKH